MARRELIYLCVRIASQSNSRTSKKVKKFLEIKTIKEKKVKKIFITKDFVVYPTHGVGQVIDIEKREVVGQKLEMYVIEFIRDKLILRVPVEKAKGLSLRKVSKQSKIICQIMVKQLFKL